MDENPEYDDGDHLVVALIVGVVVALFAGAGVWGLFFG